MFTITTVIIVIVISYAAYLLVVYMNTPTKHLTRVNGQWVNRNFNNTEEAAAILRDLNAQVVQKLAKTYPQLQSVVLLESPYDNNGDSSYTIDKKYIYLCIRRPENPKLFYELNVLSHVLIHELAHALNIYYGHGSTFKALFSHLKTDFYSISDIKPADLGVPYCGVFL